MGEYCVNRKEAGKVVYEYLKGSYSRKGWDYGDRSSEGGFEHTKIISSRSTSNVTTIGPYSRTEITTVSQVRQCRHDYRSQVTVNVNLMGIVLLGILDPTLFSYVETAGCKIGHGGNLTIWSIAPFYLLKPNCVDVYRTGRAMEYLHKH